MFQIRWHWRNLKGRRAVYILGLILSAVSMVLVIVNPKLSQILIDNVLVAGKTEQLIPLLAAMCGVQLSRTLMRYGMVMCLENASQHILLKIRMHIFSVLQNQDMRFYGHYRTGDLMTRVTGDIDLIRHFTSWIVYQSIDSVVVFIAAIILLSTISLPLTLMMLAVTPILAVISFVFIKKVRPLFGRQREKLSALNTFSQENIAGNRVIKAFAREDYEIARFAQKNDEFRNANLTVTKTWLKFFPIIESVANLLTIITVLAGGLFIINGSLTYGELMAFMGLTWALANPMRNVGTLLNDLQRFFVSADKIIELFYARPTIVDRDTAVETTERIQGEIEFRDVSFHYDGTPVLDKISFHVSPGETVAIMGPTGAGKTTIISLLSRFYDVTGGEILIDGIDVRQYKLATLRSSIGLATQDVFLFSDTVDGNISYGSPEMPESDVVLFSKAAAADEFISEMDEGYDTIVGERGVGLSGGQRQRIALARALAIRPPILVLDDTTSAVDSKTEQYIQQQLRQLDFPCTKLIIAQRISSVRDADKILVLKDGNLLIGTHNELAAQPGYYRDICELQNTADLPPLRAQEGVE